MVFLCVGGIGEVTPPLTLSSCLRYVGVLLGGDAVSLLLNLEVARQGRSMLFSDEKKLLFEGRKKGFAKNTKLDFMRC